MSFYDLSFSGLIPVPIPLPADTCAVVPSDVIPGQDVKYRVLAMVAWLPVLRDMSDTSRVAAESAVKSENLLRMYLLDDPGSPTWYFEDQIGHFEYLPEIG